MRTVLPLLALACLVAALPAETVDWTMGSAIDCPLPLAMPTKAMTRTIVFPSAITNVPVFWTDDQIYAKPVANSLILQLRDPLWSGTIQVYDDKGNLFLLNAHAASGSAAVSEMLIIRPSGSGSSAPGKGPPPTDSDGAVTDMMFYMVNGSPNPNYQSSILTRVVDDKLVVGRRIFEDDTSILDVIKVHQGPSVRGYECVLRYRGTKPGIINITGIQFPGALAVYATQQTLWDATNPTITMAPNQVVQLFFVGE